MKTLEEIDIEIMKQLDEIRATTRKFNDRIEKEPLEKDKKLLRKCRDSTENLGNTKIEELEYQKQYIIKIKSEQDDYFNSRRAYKEEAIRKANEYNAIEKPANGYNCPICKNKGLVKKVVDDDKTDDTSYSVINYICKCYDIRANIRNSGLGKLFNEYDLKNYKTPESWQKDLKKIALEFIKNPSTNLVITGQNGSGKSHMAVGIEKRLLENGHECLHMSWIDEIKQITADINSYENIEKIKRLKTVEILHIDDFGKFEPSEAVKAIAYDIVNARYVRKLITMISTEHSAKKLSKYFTEATIGRLVQKDRAVCFPIPYDEKNDKRIFEIKE